MANKSSQDVLEAAHGESHDIPFLEHLIDDLNINGVGGEAFQDAIVRAGIVLSPLEQFAIRPSIPLSFGNVYLSFTNPTLFLLLSLSAVVLVLSLVTRKGGTSVPNAVQSFSELVYDFVPAPVNDNIGGRSVNVQQRFSPRISVTFTFSLFRNALGLVPFSFTVTSHLLCTWSLSFSMFIGITLLGVERYGLHFLSVYLPEGVPLTLAPVLVLLELIPHCFRALSSGIRLFSNLMAGHSSVKILSGFAWTMLLLQDRCYLIGDPGTLLVVLALTGLELGVAILQAHVFTISICIYLNDAPNIHRFRVLAPSPSGRLPKPPYGDMQIYIVYWWWHCIVIEGALANHCD
uniref:ATP synthase subunit a n=1 Tax=Viscum minimum TaxID=1266557 RepID=A0A0R5K960_9MAGN|nr:ATP synthase F0 subunit 6 [Viscum minimum]